MFMFILSIVETILEEVNEIWHNCFCAFFITLRVEMTADAIADIKVVSQSETAGLGDVAIDKMIEAILVAGNTDVDTVSQATVSSEAVIAAVNAALSRAEKGEVDTVASPVAEAVTEETFADQCKAAGIDFTYEDPNASIYDFQTTDAAVDVITHASGKAKYVDETDGPCIRTPLDLAARSAVKVKVYYWIAADFPAQTALLREELCRLHSPALRTRLFHPRSFLCTFRRNRSSTFRVGSSPCSGVCSPIQKAPCARPLRLRCHIF